jgi:hypothetical protein
MKNSAIFPVAILFTTGLAARPASTLIEELSRVDDGMAVAADGNLLNLSCRTLVGDGNAQVVGGFVLSGNRPERLLIRAVGPELANFGVTSALSSPRIELFSGETSITTNSRWGTGMGASRMSTYFGLTGAFPLTTGSTDAAIIVDLEPGAYTAVVSGENGETGVVLLEIYLITD